jgi:hypothetical protein
LKVCLLFLFARMPAAAQGMDKVNPSLSANSFKKPCKIIFYKAFLFAAYKILLKKELTSKVGEPKISRQFLPHSTHTTYKWCEARGTRCGG